MSKVVKRYAVFAAVSVLLAAGITAAIGRPLTVRVAGTRPSWARPANLVRKVSPNARVDFLAFLGWRDPAGVAAVAHAVSDPGSASYGRYLTAAAFRARFSPTVADVAAVRTWLRGAHLLVGAVPASRLWVAASGTASDVERALHTGLAMYRVGGKLRRAPTADPLVPASLAGIVRSFVGLSDVRMHSTIAGRIPKPPAFRNGRPCSTFWGEKIADDLPPAYGAPVSYDVCAYTPDQLRSAYGLTDPIAAGVDGTGQTVAVIDAFASPTMDRDLNIYSRRHGLPEPDLTQMNVPVTPGSKLENQQGWWGEEALDLEAIHSLAPGAKLMYFGARDNSGRGLLERAEFVVDGQLAQIVSNSYGTSGEQIPGGGYSAWEAVFQQAAAQGIGFYFSSGDCGDNQDNAGLCGGTGYITTDYSASSPWATSVGGTSLGVGQQGEYLFETGWGTTTASLGHHGWVPAPPGPFLYGGGGGTSSIFAEPDYQVGVVPDALDSHWLAHNRVVPDVAAVGDPNTGFLEGQTQAFPGGPRYGEYRIGGTSLACPLFAAIMALADQSAGRHHGFANPALYALAGSAAFNDIVDPPTTMASIRVLFLNSLNPKAGIDYALRTYNQTGTLDTAPGYDDVTGLGTPNGQAFLAAMS